MFKNICVAQSGGPTAAINSSLAGVIKSAEKDGIKIFGAKNGIDGIIKGSYVDLSSLFFGNDEKYKLLRNTPAAALGSCRLKLPPPLDESSPFYDEIFYNFKKAGIGAFFYIGGNDSMDTVDKLSAYAAKHSVGVKFIGIPKTIDNDLPETDHTPGFGSAAKFIVASVSEIICDSNVYNTDSVTIIEIMGRDAGWLTASSALLNLNNSRSNNVDLVYLPEIPFDINSFFADINKIHTYGKKPVIACVSEGIRDADGNYVGKTAMSGIADAFGHAYLSGAGKYLERRITDEIGCKVRSVELNVLQRAASHIASKTDLDEAEGCGIAAYNAFKEGKTGVMVKMLRTSETPYTIDYDTTPISECANKIKKVPLEWLNSEKNGILPEYLETYFRPLILGEEEILFENGVPKHIVI